VNENAPQRIVLLTGATGFLGAQIARRLLHETNLTIITLVRAESQAAAVRRLARAWWDWPELAAAQVEVLAGDVSQPQLGLDEEDYSQLAGRITHIIHTAADLRVNVPLDELRKTNVLGTANVLALARLAQRDHGLERYAHVSTAYVAGGRTGVVAEADLSGEYGFANPYELSKYEGECLVQAAKSELPVSVFRPGMIAGATDTGEIRTFNTFYFPLRLYLSGKLPFLPVDPALPVNIVPVDYVAEAVARLTFHPQAKGLNFHLTAPNVSLPRAGELVKFTRAWAREHLGLRLPRPVFIPLPLPLLHYRPDLAPAEQAGGKVRAWRKLLWPELKGLLTLRPYFNERKQFQRDNVDRLLGPYKLEWRNYLPNLLSYAVDQGFLHRYERTVHEQLLARLESKTRPVNYFDIVQGRVIPRSAEEVRREILAAAGALSAMGIQPGDRVAVVGLNSTRYLALDAAIGLIGAVSVPLYYTSPPAEIDHILSSSGAKLLLVGAPKILDRLGEIRTILPVVSFYREPAPAQLDREVISWETFLALGSGRPVSLQTPVGFGDLATLRYTSGTTGRPKGVSFQHQHLRWMAQTMACLLPWKARIRTANALSFLPMNHVTEGILATYAPYYLPTKVNIYFLEDLKDIRNALPRVRPSVFFSVPRIYERIWEALEKNRVGRYYLSLPSGWWKRAVGTLLRRQTLKKAGMDRCAMLIAGSAPCSQEMLQNFRQLGIEIHNAYGLSEAPLVTLNRQEANRLGTVGEPLPQTEIRLAADGEVMVRGPQVMAGYYEGQIDEKIAQPFRDGWLLTGDLGHLTPEGSLVLHGRKKELFKTSYAKYVQPAKIEGLLREIPGVAEAMLIGEGRPYCAALLWVDDKSPDRDNGQRIDRRIEQINRDLSHPEQVKRWAVLANDLSIEAGDLTSNLKLKRGAVSQRLKDVVEGLYDGARPSQAVLYIGEAAKG
jgi:long-chain acyl-CoA synthetase